MRPATDFAGSGGRRWLFLLGLGEWAVLRPAACHATTSTGDAATPPAMPCDLAGYFGGAAVRRCRGATSDRGGAGSQGTCAAEVNVVFSLSHESGGKRMAWGRINGEWMTWGTYPMAKDGRIGRPARDRSPSVALFPFLFGKQQFAVFSFKGKVRRHT